MEMGVDKLQALLETCVQIIQQENNVNCSTNNTIHHETTKQEEIANVLNIDQDFWNQLSLENPQNPMLNNFSLLLATADISIETLGQILCTLLQHSIFHCEGIIHYVQRTFQNLKRAKRYDALLYLSSSLLLDPLYKKMEDQNTRNRALQFWVEILLGYQHSGELYAANLEQLIALVPMVVEYNTMQQQNGEEMENNVTQEVQNNSLPSFAQMFTTSCLALMHCHRGYEQEAYRLTHQLIAYGLLKVNALEPLNDNITLAAAEWLLVQNAWFLPNEIVNLYLPSIEGQWDIDEYGGVKKDTGQTGTMASPISLVENENTNNNVGSVAFKKVGSCLAYPFQADIETQQIGVNNYARFLSLQGSVFHAAPTMQAIESGKTTYSQQNWVLEGQWKLFKNNVNGKNITTVQSSGWDCSVCTLHNQPGGTSCATCAAMAPPFTLPNTTNSNHEGYPYPFVGTFDASMSYMYLRWSKGDERGIWLARKHNILQEISLTDNVRCEFPLGNVVTEIPILAYSPHGHSENVLILQRHSYSMTAYPSVSIRVGVRMMLGVNTSKQTIIANQDFELYIINEVELIWEIKKISNTGPYLLKVENAINIDVFSWISIMWTPQAYIMFVDDHVAAMINRNDVENTVPASGAKDIPVNAGLDPAPASVPAFPFMTIGGSITADKDIASEFIGIIMGLTIHTVPENAADACTIGTILYSFHDNQTNFIQQTLCNMPLVGDATRLFLDLSPLANHACLFRDFHHTMSGWDLSAKLHKISDQKEHTRSFPEIPIDMSTSNFTGRLGAFLVSGAISIDKETEGLLIHRKKSHQSYNGAAIWTSDAMNLSHGFTSDFKVEFDNSACVTRETVLALSAANYWAVKPLVIESENHPLNNKSNISEMNGHKAIFVKVTKIYDSEDKTPLASYSIGVFVWSEKLQRSLPLARVHRFTDHDNRVMNVRVVYTVPDKILSIYLGEQANFVLECAVDFQQVLQGIEDNSSAQYRVGLIFPVPSVGVSCEMEDDVNDMKQVTDKLTVWSAISTPESDSQYSQDKIPILKNVYPSMYANSGLHSGDMIGTLNSNGVDKTVLCTRAGSGEPIEQEGFGCQTCDSVHGASMCRNCAIICHEGHELVAMGPVFNFSCACITKGFCQLQESPNAQLSTSIASKLSQKDRIAPRLWCCAKCTVINSMDMKNCEVCGHQNPNQNPEKVEPPVSNSRALVLVDNEPSNKLDIPMQQAQWSCTACTMLNDEPLTHCTICNTERPGGNTNSEASGLHALFQVAESVQNLAAPEADASLNDWTCNVCTMGNKGSDRNCHMCSAERPSNSAPLNVDNSSNVQDVVMGVPIAEGPIDMDVSCSPVSDIRIENLLEHLDYKKSATNKVLFNPDIMDHTLSKQLEFGGVVWDTTVGLMKMNDQDISTNPHTAEYIHGKFISNTKGVTKFSGELFGLAKYVCQNKDQKAWVLQGVYDKFNANSVSPPPYTFNLTFDVQATNFEGKWFRGETSGDWNCASKSLSKNFRGFDSLTENNRLTKSSTEVPSQLPFYTGLMNGKENLTNVCYQNSFIQTLFMTQEFRRLLLTKPALNKQAENSNISLQLCVQELFANLLSSQRPEATSHNLQRYLPPLFQAGRQQDTSDFAHFLVDALTESETPMDQPQHTTESTVAKIFGGQQATIISCKNCDKKSINREYFWELLLNMIDLKYTPITSITAVEGASTTIPVPEMYERLNFDLNKDRVNAPYVFLCLKRQPIATTIEDMMSIDAPITELVIKTALNIDGKPTMPGYERVELDLNVGGTANTSALKKQVYLFYKRDTNGSPITDISIIYGSEATPDGFRLIPVDLNQGEGTKVFLCYRCDMPIADVKVFSDVRTEPFMGGYKLLDDSVLLQPQSNNGEKFYIGLKVGGSGACLTDVKLARSTEEVEQAKSEGWISVPGSQQLFPPSENESEESSSNDSCTELLIRRGDGNPIVAMDIYRAPRKVPKYKDYEIIDMYPQLLQEFSDQVTGNWLSSDSGEDDRDRRFVRLQTTRNIEMDSNVTLMLQGSFDGGGELFGIGIVSPRSEDQYATWGQAVTASLSSSSAENDAINHTVQFTGYWISPITSSPQLLDLKLTPEATGNIIKYTLHGMVGNGNGMLLKLHGLQVSQEITIEQPIVNIAIVRPGETLDGIWDVIKTTYSGRSGNLLEHTQSQEVIYLAVQRGSLDSFPSYVADVVVVYGDIDAIPENYECIKTTPSGLSANLNAGTTGVPLYLCVKHASCDIIGTSPPQCLMGINTICTAGLTPADQLPEGMTKVSHTPLGMEANLNQGASSVEMYLCLRKGEVNDLTYPQPHPLNGEYELTPVIVGAAFPTTKFRLFVTNQIVNQDSTRNVTGNFGPVAHRNSFSGTISGIQYTVEGKTMVTGMWSASSNISSHIASNWFPLQLELKQPDGDVPELVGWYGDTSAVQTAASSTSGTTTTAKTGRKTSNSKTRGGRPWTLIQDSYVKLAFKKDYGTEWKDKRLISSERVSQHDLDSLLARLMASRTLGGDNSLFCENCQSKTESRTTSAIIDPPAHLILTLKRMFYDWTQQKTRKCLHDVAFPSCLILPPLQDDEKELLGVKLSDDNHIRDRTYGLYGVLVHSGMTANSGHYYSFCRESNDTMKELHLNDSKFAPWIKFNDSKVERSSWYEIQASIASSVSDTSYILLYKRLNYDVKQVCESEESKEDGTSGDAGEEEAMLLAKAMALSMSKSEPDAHEEKNVDDVKWIDVNLLRKVEQSNIAYIEELHQATSSCIHYDDIHTILAQRYELPFNISKILNIGNRSRNE